MSTPSARELRRYLKTLPPETLIDDLVLFFSRHDGVREFYTARMGRVPDEEALEKYKKTIRNEFFPTRGFGHARLSIARKAVTDYQKIAHHPPHVIDLMLFYVEQGVAFTNAYGDINEPFYDSMLSMYEKALRTIAEHGLLDRYRVRCKEIVDRTEGMGWGFHDGLRDAFAEAYDDR